LVEPTDIAFCRLIGAVFGRGRQKLRRNAGEAESYVVELLQALDRPSASIRRGALEPLSQTIALGQSFSEVGAPDLAVHDCRGPERTGGDAKG
jgi:hypothetical protein